MNQMIDWAELNSDLLCIIAKQLRDISDFIKFRAVCKQWRSIPNRFESPQLPWFFQLHTKQLKHSNSYTQSEPRFFSLISNKIHTIKVPVLGPKLLRGPASHYLLVWKYPNKSPPVLLNPLTNTKLVFPFEESAWYTPIYVGPDPNSKEDVLGVFHAVRKKSHPMYSSIVSIWRSNNKKWTHFNAPRSAAKAYCQGRIYMSLTWDRVTKVIDVTTRRVLFCVPHPPKEYIINCLVEASGEVLAVICRREPFGVALYKLELEDGYGHWIKVNNIGDHIMFIDWASYGSTCLHSYDHGFCLKASNFDGFTGNCIYFKEWNGHIGKAAKCFLYRYDLKEGILHQLPQTIDFNGTWFVPRLY